MAKKFKFVFLVMLALLTLAVAGCGGGGGDEGSDSGNIRVVNAAANSVYYLYVSPTSTSNWGPDQLGNRTIPPGGTFTLTDVEPGRYDVKLVMSSGSEYFLMNIEVVAGGTFTVNNPYYNNKEQSAAVTDGKVESTVMDATDGYLVPEQGEGPSK